MYAFDSETHPTLVGSGSAGNLLESLAPEEDHNWASHFMTAAAVHPPTSTRPPTEVDLVLPLPADLPQHELNTPTIEMASAWSFGVENSVVAPSAVQPQSEQILVEFTLPSSSNDLDSLMEAQIEQEWGNLDSPGEFMTGVCPMDVEGKTASLENVIFTRTTADSGGCVQEVPVVQPTLTGSVTVPQEAGFVEALVLPAAQEEGVVLPPPVEAKVESPQLFVDGDLFNWLDNDKFDQNSEMPGEVKDEDDEEFIPTTINQAEFSQILPAQTPNFQIRLPKSVAEETLYQPASTSRKRSRNISVASSASSSTTDAPKRGRGRPPRPPGRAITPAVVRGRIVSEEPDIGGASTDGNLTDAEITDLRYRRMRDLNNEASKRCRENRKRKNQQLEEEAEQLMLKNARLKERLKKLERTVLKAKNFYIRHLSQVPVDRSLPWSTGPAETVLGEI